MLLLGATAITALVAGPALAADLPVRGPVYKSPPPVVYNWTGFYGGVNVGYSWGRQSNDWVVPGFFAVSEGQNMNGVIGGVQWGYNWQIGTWLIGTEGDFQGSAQRGSTTYCVDPGCITSVAADHKLPWFGTSRARIGYLPSQYFLMYVTGGLAYGEIRSDYGLFAGGLNVAQSNFKDIRAGYTVGGGIEGAFGGGWSAKLEYLWVDLGSATSTTTLGGFVVDSYSSRVTDNIVRIGLNYKLGGGSY
jgi:outer membrane immunogenic protein